MNRFFSPLTLSVPGLPGDRCAFALPSKFVENSAPAGCVAAPTQDLGKTSPEGTISERTVLGHPVLSTVLWAGPSLAS